LGSKKFISKSTKNSTNHLSQVSTDEEAIKLMNDSPYGLTASVWTNASGNPASEAAFLNIVDQLETGTVFLNRCDTVDPALAWTGVKNSGRGISLSKFGECSKLFPMTIAWLTTLRL
jgi:acyl-CoA reductase-like NAD-dependent aldehyde dehydrogenase